jgi:transcriptional regulator of acetoin/glycerol metabolism
MRMLRSYGWPGNVRELFAVVESAAIRCDENRIETQHLPPELRAVADRRRPPSEARSRPLAPADERSAILAALNETGNRSRAAELLGVGRTTLWRKMKQYGIAGPTE